MGRGLHFLKPPPTHTQGSSPVPHVLNTKEFYPQTVSPGDVRDIKEKGLYGMKLRYP